MGCELAEVRSKMRRRLKCVVLNQAWPTYDPRDVLYFYLAKIFININTLSVAIYFDFKTCVLSSRGNKNIINTYRIIRIRLDLRFSNFINLTYGLQGKILFALIIGYKN